MDNCKTLRPAFDGMSAQALRELLCREQDTAALLTAAEALLARPDAAVPHADTEAALRRFRTDFLPTAAIDPDVTTQPRAPRRLARILPLAAILMLALGMLVYAGHRQQRMRTSVTAITRRATNSDISFLPTDGAIPSFSIALPQRFELDGVTPGDDGETVVYYDLLDSARTISITFSPGASVSFAPDAADDAEEITLGNFDVPAALVTHGDTIQIAVTDIGGNALYLIVIETHGLTRDEAVAAAESLHFLPEEAAS